MNAKYRVLWISLFVIALFAGLSVTQAQTGAKADRASSFETPTARPTGRSFGIDTVIVGGGHAGLAISYYLTQEGRRHVELERESTVANAWRNQRWDSFTGPVCLVPASRLVVRKSSADEMRVYQY